MFRVFAMEQNEKMVHKEEKKNHSLTSDLDRAVVELSFTLPSKALDSTLMVW